MTEDRLLAARAVLNAVPAREVTGEITWREDEGLVYVYEDEVPVMMLSRSDWDEIRGDH